MKKKLVAGFIAVFLIGAAFYYFWQVKNKNETLYRESKVIRGSIALTVTATGSAHPENRLDIRPPIAGRADQVLVQEGQKVKKGQILIWMSSTERAALLDAARAEGQGEVKRWEEMYRPTPVIAPIAGTIILRSIEAGQTFSNADSILVMSDRLTVKALVDETDIAQIKLKQSAEIILDAYPNEKIEATVDKIAYDAKTVSNVTTYVVDVLPLDTPAFLRSGMTANIRFQIQSKENILTVPTEAIRQENGKAFVSTRAADGTVIEKSVEVGVSDGKKTEVLSGLNENETVLSIITKPKEKLKGANSPLGGATSRPSGGGGRH